MNRTSRKEYLDTNISSTSQMFLPQNYCNLVKNKSYSILQDDDTPKAGIIRVNNFNRYNKDIKNIKQSEK